MIYQITNLKSKRKYFVETYDQALDLFLLFFGQEFWPVRKDDKTWWVDCGNTNEGFEIKATE